MLIPANHGSARVGIPLRWVGEGVGTDIRHSWLGILVCFSMILASFTLARGQEPTPEPKPDPVVEQEQEPAVEKTVPAPTFVVVEGQVTDSMGRGEMGVTLTVRRKGDDGTVGEVIGETTTDEMGDFAVRSPKPVQGDIVVTLSKPMFTEMVREFHLGDDEYPPYVAETLEGSLVAIGRVVDVRSQKAVADAAVVLKAAERDWFTTTDEEGEFTIKGVVPGQGELVVEAEGYGRERQSVASLEDFGEIIVQINPERIVRLKIVNDLDQPIAQAMIELLDEDRDDFRTVMTDAEGSIAIRGLHFETNSLQLRLTHEQHVSSEVFDQEITLPADQVDSTHKLVMARAGSIQGRVLDAKTGKPINGARVMTGDGHADTSPRDWADYQGSFHVQGIPPGETLVTVHVDGFAPDLKRIEVEAGKTAELDFPLGPARVIKGVVKTEGGEPIPHAMVDAVRWRGEETLGLRAIADTEGRFELDSAPMDEFEISAYARGMGEKSVTVVPNLSYALELTLSGTLRRGPAMAARQVKAGDDAPPLKVRTLDGKSIDLADLRGKVVLLDFWATWCGPCAADFPHLLKTYETFGKRDDFMMIGVSLDDDEKTLRDFLKKKGAKWSQVYGEAGGAQVAADQYGVVGIPAVFLIGGDGKLIAADVPGSQVAGFVEKALKEVGSP